jgi:hypothetical protein
VFEQNKLNGREATDPTRQEIEERSAEVRSGWSKAVSQRRQAWFDPAWRPPLILTIDLVRQMNEKQE